MLVGHGKQRAAKGRGFMGANWTAGMTSLACVTDAGRVLRHSMDKYCQCPTVVSVSDSEKMHGLNLAITSGRCVRETVLSHVIFKPPVHIKG